MPNRPGAQGDTEGLEPQGEALSPAVENYLLALYDLQEDWGAPTPTQLAEQLRHFPQGEALGTTLPSVTGMVRRLQREGLVEVGSGKRITLTARGIEAAEDVARRHHLAECLLAEVLGVELPHADQEAHRLEHYISAEVLARIDHLLGRPTICPYGRPIPGSGYQKPAAPIIPLSQAIAGGRYMVVQLPEDDERLIRFLVDHSVVPTQEVTVLEVAPYRDTVTLTAGKGEASIGHRVAQTIRVCPAGGGEGIEQNPSNANHG